MKVVHTIPSVGPNSFGLGLVALHLVREQIKFGVDSKIWCLDTMSDVKWASVSSGLSKDKIRSFPRTGPKMLGLSFAMESTLQREIVPGAIIHQHAIWTGLSRVTNSLYPRGNIHSVITPHGSLEKWALKRSRWKKQVALSLYERNNLQHASCLHACSEQEVAGFRDFGLVNPIAVIPNGISDDWLNSSGSAANFRKQFNLPKDKRIMLFLSRITPVKGLLMLVEALHSIRQHADDWILVIAGSDEFNHTKEVLEKIRKFNLEDRIYFSGLLVDQVKRDAFAAAELFVLPTKRENYGIVVAEALGAGLPVLTTKGAPWEDLVDHHCGWWSDVNYTAISQALFAALSCSPDQLKNMGQKGKERAAAEYTWVKSARMTIELYEWLVGCRDRPEFVLID